MSVDTSEIGPSTGLFEPGVTLDFVSHDLDDMAQRMLFWGVELQQLGCGRFSSGVRAVHSPRVQLSAGYREPGVAIRGAIPRGATTVSSVVAQAGPLYLHGVALGERELALVDSRHELDFRSVGRNELVTASIESQLFHRAAQAMLGRAAPSDDPTWRLTLSGAARRAALNRRLQALLDEACADPQRLRRAEFAERWELRVLDALLGEIEIVAERGSAPWRRRAAHRAEAYLRDACDRPVSISELCLETGAPKRTLMLGFLEAFGLPPIAYHKRLRLNQARRELLRARRGEVTVSAVALRWGFEHFGRFSVDYRQMFNESPAQTLRGG